MKKNVRPPSSARRCAATLAEEAARIIRSEAYEAAERKPPVSRLPASLAFALGAVLSSALIGTVALAVCLF